MGPMTDDDEAVTEREIDDAVREVRQSLTFDNAGTLWMLSTAKATGTAPAAAGRRPVTR